MPGGGNGDNVRDVPFDELYGLARNVPVNTTRDRDIRSDLQLRCTAEIVRAMHLHREALEKASESSEQSTDAVRKLNVKIFWLTLAMTFMSLVMLVFGAIEVF